MTDGIIQQVLKPSYHFISRINDNFEPAYAGMIIDYYKQDLKSMQQELIEKIRESYTDYRKDWLSILIGDNKE